MTASSKHNSTGSPQASANKNADRHSGVADYFAILGVGPTLTWKHQQKKQEVQEDAILWERFFREIVQVEIITVAGAETAPHNNHQQHGHSHHNNPNHSVSLADESFSQSHQQPQYIQVTIPPVASDVTSTIAGTDISTRLEYNGLSLVPMTKPLAAPVLHNDAKTGRPMAPLWQKGQTLDANLDPSNGLSRDLISLQEELTKLQKQQKTPLKDLQRKFASTLRRPRSSRNDGNFGNKYKYYLGIRRRAPDESDVPAIADIELLYVKLHKATIIEAKHDTVEAGSVVSSGLPPISSLLGSAKKAGNIVRDRVVGAADVHSPHHYPDPFSDSDNNNNNNPEQVVNLKELLSVPIGYDEIRVPIHYEYIQLPKNKPESPAKTLIFADDSSSNNIEAMMEQKHATSSQTWRSMIQPIMVRDVPVDWDSEYDEYTYIPIVAVRRQRVGDEERYHEDAALVDIAVTFSDGQGAVLPDDTQWSDDDFEDDGAKEEGIVSLLGTSEWMPALPKTKNDSDQTTHRAPPRFASTMLIVKRNNPLGFCDAAFATAVLDRFPLKNYKGLPLPEEELPMFCYPSGCRLYRAPFSEAPLPQYYGFVVKNEQGDSIYVSCVSFMEPLQASKVQQLNRMSRSRRRVSLPHKFYCEENDASSPSEESPNILVTEFNEMTTFENKTICLISRYPFWTAFRRYLSHLHIQSGSTSDLPLERAISHLLLTVPVPKPGGPNILIPLPALNIPMVLGLPPQKDFPLVDLPYDRLLACLDVPTVVTVVLGFLALERKVIVMSTRPSLVLDACELLRSLLFPFELCAPYVPRLTEPFMSCLDFPGAIFVGIHDDGTQDGLAAIVRKNMPEDSMIVDLDAGSVDCSGDRMVVLNSSWGVIPPGLRSNLVSEIETLCRDAGIVPGQEPLDSQIDAAFDASIPVALVQDIGTTHAKQEPLDDRAIRDAFLRFFCSVLGGYERYLVVPDVDFLISGNEWFDSKGFLASVSEEKALFLGPFVSTQLFQAFIQRRTEASDVLCLLFDECLQEYHSSPVPFGRLGGDVETVSVPGSDTPQLVYSLLVDQAAEETHLPMVPERSFDESSQHESEADSSSHHLTKVSQSTVETAHDRLIKNSDFAMNSTGDWVTVPSRKELPVGTLYIHCVDGNSSFPDRMNGDLYLPKEPESWLVEMSGVTPTPMLARSNYELEEADRQRRQATTSRGLQRQRRCLWQLPKLMGSHFLGSWLLCIPAQVAQPGLSTDLQSRYLLRALGVLRSLRSKQRIVPDEAAYRALMVACGRTKNDRRTELVRLFGLLRSDGIFPSAVTLGQYTRALAEGYSKRSLTTEEEDSAGVEVTESASRELRLGITKQHGVDAETVLSALDGNLASLEESGRRWRQKSNGTEKEGVATGDDPSAGNESKQSHVDRQAGVKKRNMYRPWLPVNFSSSFAPGICDESGTVECRPLMSDCLTLTAIWSRTKCCDSCGYIPLEEEVQAGWDTMEDHEVPGAIDCPRCGSLIIPMLGYKEMSIDEALSEYLSSFEGDIDLPADFSSLPPQVRPVVDSSIEKASFVPYLSPSALRLSLERHVSEQGEAGLDRDRLRETDPETFYNFFWYCARFSLPLPLPIDRSDDKKPKHFCALAAWDPIVALRGCNTCAKALGPYLEDVSSSMSASDIPEPVESLEEYPLIARFNLQGYFASVWDHEDLSKILVALVEACDKRDFKPVIEILQQCNQRRRAAFEGGNNQLEQQQDGSTSQVGRVNHDSSFSGGIAAGSTATTNFDPDAVRTYELDIYKTILYLAKYQCTTAFHAFFPATLKPCKGYHYWCPQVPLPILDRLLRDAMKRAGRKPNEPPTTGVIWEVSDVALGFRCVFGHLI